MATKNNVHYHIERYRAKRREAKSLRLLKDELDMDAEYEIDTEYTEVPVLVLECPTCKSMGMKLLNQMFICVSDECGAEYDIDSYILHKQKP